MTRGSAIQRMHPTSAELMPQTRRAEQVGDLERRRRDIPWPPGVSASPERRPLPIAAILTELPLLISVPRAAALLGISRSAAYRFAEVGDLPVRRLGRRVYVVTRRLGDLVGEEL